MFGSNLGSQVNEIRSADVVEKNTQQMRPVYAQLLISALIFPRLQIIRFASLGPIFTLPLMLFLFFPQRHGSYVCVRASEKEYEHAQHIHTHTHARYGTHIRAPISLSPCVCVDVRVHVCESLTVFGGAAAHVHSHKFIFMHTNIQSGTHTHTFVLKPFPPFAIV